MTYRMIFNQTGYSGRGGIANIPQEIIKRGLSKAFIVTDPALVGNGTVTRITDLLDEVGIAWDVFSDVVPNPPVEKVQALLAAFRNSGAEILIGLGGGRPQDTCKAISVVATTPEFEDVLSLEGYITRGAWALSDALCLKSIQMIAKNLRAAAEGDLDAVEQMGLAAYMNGVAYSNVGLGLVHSMAHPLGGRYDAPHGLANGILLAKVMAFNAEYTGEKYRDIDAAFGVEGAHTMPLDEVRQAAVDAVAQLTVELGNPTTISEIGVTEDGIAGLTDDAFADVCTPGNPRPVTRDDVEAIYRSLM